MEGEAVVHIPAVDYTAAEPVAPLQDFHIV